MKARKFSVSDHKIKTDRWNVYYQSLQMQDYVATLEFDDVTGFIEEHTRELSPGDPILDVGCGAGRHLVHLSRLGFENLHGVDLSQQGIAKVRKALPYARASVGDATRLPYPDDCFSLVVMVGIVYEIPDAALHQKVFDEIARVLKPGGRLLYINNSPYNLGERVFTCTQALSRIISREPAKFFVWRYDSQDVLGMADRAKLEVIREWPANIRRGVYRFFYGVFVSNRTRKRRHERLRRDGGQPYGLHEYYLVHKDESLLNGAGRWLADFSERRWRTLFANTYCYFMKKPEA